MSRKANKAQQIPFKAGSKKTERYIQPSLLMALTQKASYGYELIQGICQFGFVDGPAPPGMIYRHLRDLENNGLVVSQWETDGVGPARRVYQLSEEGRQVLKYWIAYMKEQAQKLLAFVEQYETMV